MLAGEQRGRHHDGDLAAGQRRDEGGAQRHLGLAEADIAADQPVHRRAGGEIVDHRVDGRLLVLGLLIGEAGGELVVDALRRGQRRRRLGGARRRHLDQRLGHVADALLHPRLARLPGDAAELVELHVGFLRAVARQKLDVLDRQIDAVVAGIEDFEAVVRGAGRLDGLQADEAADAVVDVDDEVAFGKRGDVGEEIGGAALGVRAHQTVAEDVLLADEGERRRCRSRIRGRARRAPSCRGRASAASGQSATGFQPRQAMIDQNLAHAVARALAPAGDDDALACLDGRRDMVDDRVEDVDVAGRALGREAARGAPAHVDDA